MSKPIYFPLLNPNEPEALLVALLVNDGQQIVDGDLLCTLETTKSTADVLAESSGFVVGLRVEEGQTVQAGDRMCYLADSPDWLPPEEEVDSDGERSQSEISESVLPPGLRITQPAMKLVQEKSLDLEQFPLGPMITESMVRSLIEKSTQTDLPIPQAEFDPTMIIIYGCGGHGKACLEMLRSLGTYRVIGFIDDGVPAGKTILGVPVLGGSEKLPELRAQGVRLAVNAVGGIGNLAVRIKVFSILAELGFACPSIVHPSAFIEASATLSPGVQVFPQAYVGSEAQVGFGCIVNTGAIVSHDCNLGELANISPGAILAGAVHVGDRALIGMGATINLKATIGSSARVGNGATVKSDVPENGIVRAGGIWPT